MANLVTTGMSGLDAQLGGGLPRGTTVVLLADPSNALSLFAQQFSAGGVLGGEEVFHFEFDRPPYGVGDEVRALVKAEGGMPKGRLTVYDGYSSQFSNGHHGNGNGNGNGQPKEGVQRFDRKQAFAGMLNQLLSLPPGSKYRLVVNSLSALVRKNEDEALEFVNNLVHAGREMNGVQLVTIVRGLHTASFETALKHVASGVMEMGQERKGFGVYSYLQVTKLLDVRDPTRLLLFKETEKGLWLESTKRVF